MNLLSRSLVAAASAAAAILFAGCATPAQAPATTQPALSAMAQPYADGLRKAGIQSVQVFASGARVRVATYLGDVYVRYPSGLGTTAFVVYVDPTTIEVDSDSYDSGNTARYEAAMKAVLPASIKLASENNARIRQQRILYDN